MGFFGSVPYIRFDYGNYKDQLSKRDGHKHVFMFNMVRSMSPVNETGTFEDYQLIEGFISGMQNDNYGILDIQMSPLSMSGVSLGLAFMIVYM